MSSLKIILIRIMNRIILNDPLVEPEQPPTIIKPRIKSFKYSGHKLKSSVTKPVVVCMDTTVNAAFLNASPALPSGDTLVSPQVTIRMPMIKIEQ